MTRGPIAQDLPLVVRLGAPAQCECGERVPSGERVGAVVALDRVFCLACMADIQAGRLDLAALAPAVAAAEYAARVRASADRLVHRLEAARLMGSLTAEQVELTTAPVPQPVEVRVEPRAERA